LKEKDKEKGQRERSKRMEKENGQKKRERNEKVKEK
jgi:hypothetical protein